MNNKEFAKQLERRTKQFAIAIIRLSIMLPKTEETRVIKQQIAKSGTSVGANYREANRARSKADFRNKIRICKGEASETLFWLEIIQELKITDMEIILENITEAKELLAIFSSIVRNL